jgi:O-methyltransferase
MARDQHPAPLESARARPISPSPTSPRDLYLDLLIRALANTIYGDPATGIYMHPDVTPENMAAYGAAYREVGLDWPLVAHTMVGLRRLENLRELTQRVVDEGIPGDLIETGAWRGGCCILMRGVLKANGVTRGGVRQFKKINDFAKSGNT